MKILHVWDVAGVSVTLAKFMDRMYATNSSIMMRRVFDPFNFVDEKYLYDSSARDFLINTVFSARKYDIIHIHSIDKPLFLKALRYLYNKKIILHYHGTEIRDRWLEKRDR
ncbi:MAG: hypothetical protein QXK74_01095 [Candidatus Nitrosocaldaceae archaeon]